MKAHVRMDTRPRGAIAGPATLIVLVLGLCWVAFASPAKAQVEGVSYTLSPVGQRVYWDDEAGLNDGYLYGGEVGLGFGQYLQLSGQYLLGNDFETDFSDYDAFEDTGFQGLERDVDIRRYGGQLRLNLGASEFMPFVTVGAGVIRFDPDGVEESENIYATGGAGLTFSVADRYTLNVGGELMAYRYNPVTTFLTEEERGQVGSPGDFRETVYNPSIRATLRIYLGGREPGELTALDRSLIDQFNGGGVRLFVEPFYGRIEFNDALNFPKDQNLAGVNAGLELGPYVGLRGFYWRGASGEEDVFDEFAESFEDIAFYGGELNLRFGGQLGQQSFVPFLILGGGYMDVLGDYEDDYQGTQPPPDDNYFATGGAGVNFALSNSLKLQGGLRYLFMSREDPEDVTAPSEVYGSPMYTAGLQFSFGGGGEQPGDVLEERQEQVREEREEVRAELLAREQATRSEIERLRARIDSLEGALQQRAAEPQVPEERGEEAETVRELERQVEELEREEQARGRQQPEAEPQRAPAQRGERSASNLSDQTVTIPVPERGEIYVRFGEGQEDADVETVYGPPSVQVAPPTGGVRQQAAPGQQQLSAQEIENIVRETLRREVGQAQAAGDTLSEADIRAIVREALQESGAAGGEGLSDTQQLNRLQNRIDRIETRLNQRLDLMEERMRREIAEVQRETPPEVEIIERGEEEGETVTRVRERRGGELRLFGDRQLVNLFPHTGVRAGDGPTQFLLGLRGDYRSDPTARLRLLPEVALGFGDGVSFNLVANAAYPFAGQYAAPLQPYAGAGLGLITDRGLSGLSLGINVLVGAEYPLRTGGSVFGEFNTFNFFGGPSRLLIGYRVRF